MPGRRPVKRGSFGSHFDELVKQFAEGQHASAASSNRSRERRKSQQEERSIHALLFERAWKLDRQD